MVLLSLEMLLLERQTVKGREKLKRRRLKGTYMTSTGLHDSAVQSSVRQVLRIK